jgi:diadenosine tetraphosphatase ApaH/serine/threonine PP2A family protein phosphatase
VRIFTPDYRFITPEECNYQYRLNDQRVMINVGSVGQPRDGDRRACYVILDEDLVIFRRLEYPCEETRRKIYAVAELDNQLGDRLLTGR